MNRWYDNDLIDVNASSHTIFPVYLYIEATKDFGAKRDVLAQNYIEYQHISI